MAAASADAKSASKPERTTMIIKVGDDKQYDVAGVCTLTAHGIENEQEVDKLRHSVRSQVEELRNKLRSLANKRLVHVNYACYGWGICPAFLTGVTHPFAVEVLLEREASIKMVIKEALEKWNVEVVTRNICILTGDIMPDTWLNTSSAKFTQSPAIINPNTP